MALLELPLPRPRLQFRFVFGLREPPRDGIWHAYTPLLLVRLTSGRWSRPEGQIWCRYSSGRWEFQQDEETEEEWLNRQW